MNARTELLQHTRRAAIIALALFLLAGLQQMAFARGKKKQEATAPAPAPQQDTSNLVWPGPPNIGRIKYITYFAGEKFDTSPASKQKKAKHSWMDRLAGINPSPTGKLRQMPFQLLGPEGLAVDRAGNLYVADQKVGAVFIFNPTTHDVSLIRNGYEATFGWINGIAIDDDGRIFITDGKLHRVLILNKKHQVIDQIKGDLVTPVGIAIDSENRFVYVVDNDLDQVFVYDADTLKLLRQLGHRPAKKHSLTDPGDFAAPTGVALDADGNVYVTDTLNYRVEIFVADGVYISEFGQHCDGPGCFAHPKGIAVDGDGHVWVADPMLDLLQIFNKQGRLLAFIGGHGPLLGQFSDLVDVTFDRARNRVFTSEQYPGRVQEFQYVTDAEAAQLEKEREAQRAARAAARGQSVSPAVVPPTSAEPKAAPNRAPP